MPFLIIIIILLIAFITVLILRARNFTPSKNQGPTPAGPVNQINYDFDQGAALAHMQAMIRCKTVSYKDKQIEDDAPFREFPRLIKSMYPKLFSQCEYNKIGERGILLCLKGKSDSRPSVFMAHYDTVPAIEALWQKPPFEALIEDGVLWGRGTLDTKGTLLGILEAGEHLISQGFIPENTIYFAFGGDEEIGGSGAPSIVDYLKQNNIKPGFVLDEGGAIVQNIFPGVKAPCALIGTGEKGQADFELSIASKGGHASAPPRNTPIVALSKAVTRIESRPFKFTLTPPAGQMFDTLGRHSSFLYKLIFANLWCFKPLLNIICKISGGEMNALVRTTCAFTTMQGSDAQNVIPARASIGINARIIGGESIQTTQKHLQHKIKNKDINVIPMGGQNPSVYSQTEGEAWARLGSAITDIWPDTIISPYLMLASSDSRHYATISPNVYRFSAMQLSTQERRLIHGNDERIPIEKLYQTIRFYIRMICAC